MPRAPFLILAAIPAVLLGLLPSAVGTDTAKPAAQIVNESPSSNPIYAPAMGAGRSALPAASTNSQNTSILSPVPPPSPTSPTTFKNGVAIPITGTAAGTGFQNFFVEWAPGLDAVSGWQTTGVTLTGGGLTPVSSGPLANWDTGSITGAGYYTIRLTVNISNTPFQALTMVYLEPDLVSSNWPQVLDPAPADGAGVVPARNADGTYRLLMEGPAGPSATIGEFWTLPLNAPAHPTAHNAHGSFIHPAVADFTGGQDDQAMLIDFSAFPVSSSLELFQHDGTFATLATAPNLWYLGSQLVVEDLAGDSHWQTLGYGFDYTNQFAYVSAWQPDGSQYNHNFPIQLTFQNSNDGRLNRNPVLVGDINGDGKREIVAIEDLSTSTFTLALFANDGSPLTWQVPSPLSGIPVVMAAADLDNNGKLETILAANSDTQTFLHVFQPDGTERLGWPLTLANSNINSQSYLAVADLNHDGHKEIVYSHESLLFVLNPDASNFSAAWPQQASPASQSFGYNAVVIGDVDGDGFPEIVTVLNTLSTNSDPFFALGFYANQQLLAIRRDGTISKSWQLNAGNGCWLQFLPTPAIGDFNQDGITEIAVVSTIGSGACSTFPGVVTLLSTGAPFHPGLNDWPLTRHDPRATSVLLCSDFCLNASAPQTVNAGLAAQYTIKVTPNEIPYNFAVQNFSCAGLPSGAACSFSPSSVTLGNSSASTTLTISTTSRILARTLRDARSQLSLFAACFGAGFFGLLGILVAPGERKRKNLGFFCGLILLASLTAVSCGAGSPPPNPNGTLAGSYAVTVSATGNSNVPQSTKVTLNVN
jgi:VCBS repeat protein